MKPLLTKFNGLWYCRGRAGFCGLGYTPAGAFGDWAARNFKARA
jgi:hypothetical protein